MITVSVVIPCYNSSIFIRESINSVLAQTYKPTEIIVIDDGSIDNTRNVVQEFGNQVKYLYQNNAGPGKARNEGVRNAVGEYIGFLDSDDFWAPDHLQTMVRKIQENPDAGLVYCGKKWIDAEGNLIKGIIAQKNYPKGWIFRELFAANYISSSSVVVAKKDAILSVGGFPESSHFRNAEDYHLWLRISANYEIESVTECSVYYRRHESNLTLNNVSRVRGLLGCLDEAIELIENKKINENNNISNIDRVNRAKELYINASMALFSNGEYALLREVGYKAIKMRIFCRQILIRLFLSYLPKYFMEFLLSCYRSIKK